MLFNSLQFLIFFPVVTALYFLSPHRWRAVLLLAASCWFYMAFIPIYILILAFTIAVDYCAGILIEGAEGRRRRGYLVMSLVANIGVLAVFKYLRFITDNASLLAHALGSRHAIPSLDIILPIGLSFHTFQAMSYTIEVYRRNQPAERNFITYALYVMFYPQLVAGPIERPQNLLHQFYDQHQFSYERVTDGLKRMMWGFFKKVVVADRLAVLVNHVYAQPTQHQGPALILATVAFAFQIYGDFSGYSDIAIGAAQVMGFSLMDNFRQPYLARSVAEFWRRWHISLSTWFRDYLYIPLGGHGASQWRWQRNVLITFLVSGLWHGANWTFVIWGGLNGLFLLVGARTKDQQRRWLGDGYLASALHVIATFVLIDFAWIFFRADSLHDASDVVRRSFSGLSSLSRPSLVLADLGTSARDLVIVGGATLIMCLVDLFAERTDLVEWLRQRPLAMRWSVYYVVALTIVVLGHFGGQQFIYFQF